MNTEAKSERSAATGQRIRAALEGLTHKLGQGAEGTWTVWVERGESLEAVTRLKGRAAFEQVTFVTAVDRMPQTPRFQVVHQLWSLTHRDRVRVVTAVPEAEPVVPTVTHLWPGAQFMERECFDMFGIRFDGHQNLRRLLMPEEYEHHPLRKEFPHHGIEPDKLYRAWERSRRQEFFERSAQEETR